MRYLQRALLILVMALVSACSTATVDPPSTLETVASPVPAPVTAVTHLTILYTNDEHGWMEGKEKGRGAANMVGLWREREEYSEEGPYLVLSGGDMWTGPAISSWFDGESMAEVMNAMGYDAAAIGNHEFDKGISVLRERAAQSEFPFLSANIRDRESGEMADFAIPYVILEVADLQVGLIGNPGVHYRR